MGTFVLAVGGATLAWFVTAGALFFNKPVDKAYRRFESHPSVRQLPPSPSTMGKIVLAVALQCLLWAAVFVLIAPALPSGFFPRTLAFAGIIVAVKVVPRDIDRVLLTTYPGPRMTIEFIVGIVCALVVAAAFAAAL